MRLVALILAAIRSEISPRLCKLWAIFTQRIDRDFYAKATARMRFSIRAAGSSQHGRKSPKKWLQISLLQLIQSPLGFNYQKVKSRRKHDNFI